MTLYIAYGSNLNLDQMARRCPTAMVYGAGFVNGYKLAFNHVATIVPNPGDRVPVGVWTIDEDCERRLDMYEGFPHKYRKETLEVEMWDGRTVTGMAYVMNETGKALPSDHYFSVIEGGYDFVGLDKAYLFRAYEEAKET